MRNLSNIYGVFAKVCEGRRKPYRRSPDLRDSIHAALPPR